MGKILIAASFLPCRGFLNVATAHDRETVLQSKQRNFGAVLGFMLNAATPRHSNYKIVYRHGIAHFDRHINHIHIAVVANVWHFHIHTATRAW